jgi:lipoprotein NlpI
MRMRLQALFGLVAATAIAAGGSALAASKADWDDCNGQDIARAVSGCSKVLEDKAETAANQAKAHVNRGLAIQAAGGIDDAIADYADAIELDPNNPDAYWLRGMGYENLGDVDRAIADFDRTIALEPDFSDARNERATAYYAKGDVDRALADFNEAIRLNPKEAIYYGNRATVFHSKGDFARAAGDYSEVVAQDPTAYWAFLGRGIATVYSGDAGKALDDIARARELAPADPYSALWADIVGERNKRPSQLAAAAERLDMTNWPAPLVRFYLGQSTTTAVMIAAGSNGDPVRSANQVCEANFYLGEFALRSASKAEATRLLKLAADCPPDFFERSAAQAELKRLAATP